MSTINNITTSTVNMNIYNNTDQTINPNTGMHKKYGLTLHRLTIHI